jgi:hypothetical protein
MTVTGLTKKMRPYSGFRWEYTAVIYIILSGPLSKFFKLWNIALISAKHTTTHMW